METRTITNEMYFESIRNAIASEGWKVADTMNKLALDMNAISLDQYRYAARIIVKAYLHQREPILHSENEYLDSLPTY